MLEVKENNSLWQDFYFFPLQPIFKTALKAVDHWEKQVDDEYKEDGDWDSEKFPGAV